MFVSHWGGLHSANDRDLALEEEWSDILAKVSREKAFFFSRRAFIRQDVYRAALGYARTNGFLKAIHSKGQTHLPIFPRFVWALFFHGLSICAFHMIAALTMRLHQRGSKWTSAAYRPQASLKKRKYRHSTSSVTRGDDERAR